MTTNPRKKILFFLPSTTGGAERMTITIAKMLPSDEFEVCFVIVHPTLGTIVDFIPKGYKVIHIPIHNIYDFTTLRMIVILHREKPDMVFCSLLYLNFRLIVAAKFCGVKIVLRNNIDLSRTAKSSLYLAKLTYRWANMVIAQQDEMREEIIRLTGIPPGKVVTMHNPIDVEQIEEKSNVDSPYSDKDNGIRFVNVARFSQEKGHDTLLVAFAKVLKQKPDSNLYLVGKYDADSSYYKHLISIISDCSMQSNVHLVGFDVNPYRWLKNADCYVMPSRLEGLPNSLIDAMYMGLPVVATRCVPIVDRMVSSGCNGYLVPVDDADAMSVAMLKAAGLKDCKMIYRPSDKAEFIKLFTEVINTSEL